MDAVIFDMDGVIVDSDTAWRPVQEAVADAAVDGEVPFETVQGMNIDDQYDRLSDRFEMKVSRSEYEDLYDRHAERIYGEEVELMDGFHDLLAFLRARSLAVGVATSALERWAEMVIDRFDLDGAFDAVVTAEDVDRGKPHPEVYREAASRLGTAPEQCLVVEDSDHGIRAAVDAGAACLAFGCDDAGAAAETVRGATDIREAVASRLG